MVRVAVLGETDWEQRLGSSWGELVRSDTAATPFQTPQWLSLWWRLYGRAREPFVLTAYEGDDLVGVFPLFRQGSLWGAIRPMGVGPSDYLKPATRPELRTEVWKAFLDRLREERAVVDLHQVPEEATSLTPQPPLPKGEGDLIAQATCLVLDLPDTYEGYLARLSKSLRYDVRRLDKDSRARVRDDVDPAESMGILLDLHEKRWRSRGLPGAFLGRTRRFHEQWAAMGNPFLRLSVLEWDGRAVGAIYAMAMGRTTYYYQAGFDPAASSISPGTMLVAHALRQSIAEGMAHFDFCRGDEPYKRRWKPDRVVTNYRVLMGAPGLGRVGEGWNRLAWSVEERIRRRLEGGKLISRRKSSPSAEQS